MKSLSRVRLFATPWTVAYQALQSMGFSRQEYWSGLPFTSPGDLPNPGIESGSPTLQTDALPSEPLEKSLLLLSCFSRVRLFATPMDGNLPGSAVHGIFQARILEWAAISFSTGSFQHRDRTRVSWNLDLGFLASRTARGHVSILSATLCVVFS